MNLKSKDSKQSKKLPQMKFASASEALPAEKYCPQSLSLNRVAGGGPWHSPVSPEISMKSLVQSVSVSDVAAVVSNAHELVSAHLLYCTQQYPNSCLIHMLCL